MSHELTRRRLVLSILVGWLVLVVAAMFGLSAGPDGLSSLWLRDERAMELTVHLRASRVWLGLLAGAALSSTGAALQAMLRNPLADPYIIGVAGGAAVGGAVVLASAQSLIFLSLPMGAFVGALIASIGLAWFVARSSPGQRDAAILAGVVFNSFAAALLTLFKTLLPAERSYALLHWLVGNIGYVDANSLQLCTGVVLVGVLILVVLSGRLEVLSFGDVEAMRLGIPVRATRLWVYGGASLTLAVLVPHTGMIGFVGLVVPHVIRLAGGIDQRQLVICSALFGGAALVFFDGIARLSFAWLGTELPVGALTALVGAPLFAFGLAKRLWGSRA